MNHHDTQKKTEPMKLSTCEICKNPREELFTAISFTQPPNYVYVCSAACMAHLIFMGGPDESRWDEKATSHFMPILGDMYSN